ncbi:MAG: hypothetical protein R6U25_12030 [Alkalispirochaeta sp.]
MTREVLYLLGAIVLQLTLVTIVPYPWSVVAIVPAWLAAQFAGMSLRSAARLGRAILIVTIPVLLVRLIAAYELSTVITWIDYAAGLLSAAWVAGAYLAYRKPSGVQLALSALAGATPFRWSHTVADMVRSALFLLPEVIRRMRDGRDAARLRYARARHVSAVRRILSVVRATFVSLSTVPQRRAEAMIVRGLIDAPEGES